MTFDHKKMLSTLLKEVWQCLFSCQLLAFSGSFSNSLEYTVYLRIFCLIDSCEAMNLSFRKFQIWLNLGFGLRLAPLNNKLALMLGLRKTQHSGSQAVWNCIWVNGSLKTNYTYTQIWAITLGLIMRLLVSGSAYQLVCNSIEAHDLTSPVAGIVASTWMTEDKIHATSKLAFMIMNACLACSKVKLNYFDIGSRPRL